MVQGDADPYSPDEASENQKAVRITATLSKEQYQALLLISTEKKVSAAWVIRDAIDQLIEKRNASSRNGRQ
jgi:hypothetical protein